MLYFDISGVRYPITDLDPQDFDRLVEDAKRRAATIAGYPAYRRGSTGETVYPYPHRGIVLVEE